MNKRQNNLQQIREWLVKHGSITPLEALENFNCYRLSARIWDLRHSFGMDIKTVYVTQKSGESYARYELIQSPLF